MWTNRKAKKAMKAADKLDKKLDAMEESNIIREDLAERSKGQRERKSALQFVDKHLTKLELQNAIDDAKGDLFVTRDQLYNIINRSAKEIAFIESQPATPGGENRCKKLQIKFKNAVYALTLVEQTLDRLNDFMSEYEWKQVIRELTNGYKTVNAISTGSDWMTRLLFKIQKAKMAMKGNVSASEKENYFGKTIDERLNEQGAASAAANMLVTAKTSEIVSLDKQSVFDAARNGVFVSVSPYEVIHKAEEEEMKMINQQIQPEIGFQMEEQSITQEMSGSEMAKMSHKEMVEMMNNFSGQ